MDTSANPFIKPSRFAEILGYRKNGTPFYLIGGGSEGATEADLRFTVDDIERARKEEKDKLYQRLEQESEQRKAEAEARKALEEQVQALIKSQQEREAEEAAARAQAEEEARKAAEAELSAKELLAKRDQEFAEKLSSIQRDYEKKFEQFNAERAQERAMLEKEKQFASLAAYTQQRLAQEKDNIAEELLDFVGGNSQEEIDASIERVKASSAKIAQTVQETINSRMPQQRGISPTGYTPVAPFVEDSGTRTYSPEDIANMSMAEYAKFRSQIGIGGNSQGLYN